MYKLSQSNSIIRLTDNALIPFDEANTDYQEYLSWIAQGNQPEPYEVPIAELARNNVQAIQAEIDRVAATVMRNTTGDSLIKYAGFVNRYQNKATKFGQWVADVWYEAELYEVEVLAGRKPMPTPQEAVALMPPLPPIL
jgi:hypothetical protein